jgi:hypothetical protein
MTVTIYDGRFARLLDIHACDGRHEPPRYEVVFGKVGDWRPSTAHPGYSTHGVFDVCVLIDADDEAEAEAAYARAQEWVLHEVLPND